MNAQGPTEAQTRLFRLAGSQYKIRTSPDYPYWDQVSPSSHLAGEYAAVEAGWRVLLTGGEQGALAAHLAQKCAPGELWVMEDNTSAMAAIAASLKASNAHVHDGIELPGEHEGSYDAAILLHRRGRELSRRRLRIAYQALKAGGSLYLAGERRSGVQSLFNDASELCGEVSVLGYKKGHRIGVCRKAAPDTGLPAWFFADGIARDTWHQLSADLPTGSLQLSSLPGVFSYDHLDEGTALLLANTGELGGKRVLDLGCGYGVLGIFAALQGAAQVDLIDISLGALACTRKNLAELNLGNARVLPAASEPGAGGPAYEVILMNPPFHSGKEVNYNLPIGMIQGAHQWLRRGGRLVLVANRFIRYERQMKEIFSRAEIIAQTGKFHIICGTK